MTLQHLWQQSSQHEGAAQQVGSQAGAQQVGSAAQQVGSQHDAQQP
ncbi:MAG: hypothetical protein K1X74_18875 [Pirellulales bacterium]|nr:hypothetical protein [Pirellulales bacterium]